MEKAFPVKVPSKKKKKKKKKWEVLKVKTNNSLLSMLFFPFKLAKVVWLSDLKWGERMREGVLSFNGSL